MNNHSEKPLHELVSNDEFYEEVEARLEDPNERDDGGKTLLHTAAWSLEDNSKILQLLLERGADVNSVTPHGYTPLHYAVGIRKRRNGVALLEAGATVNSQDALGRTALHFATTNKRWLSSPSPIRMLGCDMWIVERLLSHPEINPNLVDQKGETPLIWAIRGMNYDAVGTMLKKGANPNIAKRNNRTPLHVALLCRNPCCLTFDYLITNGAGIYCRDVFGHTPVDILIEISSNDEAPKFASMCVGLIALRCRITQSFKRQLERIPWLSSYLDDCCHEVELMGKVRVHAKFTLHDFALDCFYARVEETVTADYAQLVEALITGVFKIYFDFIFCRISKSDLSRVLERTVFERTAKNLVPDDAPTNIIYEEIRRYYCENDLLRDRITKYTEFLRMEM